jgi:hypothetical protein
MRFQVNHENKTYKTYKSRVRLTLPLDETTLRVK